LYAPTAASVSTIISTTIASPSVAASATASTADGGNAANASTRGIEGDTCYGMTLFFACDHL
jgi:hypothetical protein